MRPALLLLLLLACVPNAPNAESAAPKAGLPAERERIASRDVGLEPGPPLRLSDRGGGTYANPPLLADFPDPSIIRVGRTFYFATTTFANVPALTILQSQDLVNWRYAGHVIEELDGAPDYDLEDGGAYRRGVFAPSLRHDEGTFYVAVTPVGQNTRIYRSQSASGPWTYEELGEEAFDPALFFDDDRTPYLATAAAFVPGYEGRVILHRLNADLSEIVSSETILVHPGAEGTKIVKRRGRYFMFHSIPGRLGMTVARADDLSGPWEVRPSIDDRTGGHQGAIVDLPDGTDYGFVMVDAGGIGRLTNISPVHWKDGWPIWGTPEAPGRVPASAPKPIKGVAPHMPQTSDDFSSSRLGLQWQWNHNPVDGRWSLTERPGFLRLRAAAADSFWTARNTLTQKGWGPFTRVRAKLDIANLAPGDECGLGTLGKYSAHIAVIGGEGGRHTLAMRVIEDLGDGAPQDVELRAQGVGAYSDLVYLRADLDFEADEGALFYSFDAEDWTPLGGAFPLAFDWRTGTFQGQQIALFCYNPAPDGGFVDIDEVALSGRG
ncbi:glycoside hydrolase 43 family protein [Parvularcula oceani]|uniref:glycoside hydrolase family 43 protein n=1 Tax=Parvularcula oceani TaxID=1247963 RepID=UPI0009E0580D|nr:glycoside hydrolase 43 family protein [Parvularcula oceani]